jgi:outer membrane usher protein FimD/PapC
VVIRDRFGGEVRVPQEFYFSESLLRAGLQEYSYGVGFLRRDFGHEGSDYGDPAFSAFHRYGLSDAVTVEFGAEGGRDFLNGGPSVSFLAGDFGQVAAAFRASRWAGESGSSWGAAYGYQGLHFGAHLLARGNSRSYAALGGEEPTAPERSTRFEAGASYQHQRLGTLGASWSQETFFREESRSDLALSWSSSLAGVLSLHALVRRELEPEPDYRFFFGVRYDLSSRDHLSASAAGGAGADEITVEAGRAVPEGEGFGYQARAGRQGGTTLGSAGVDFHASYADLRAAFQGTVADGGGSHGRVDVSVAGSVAVAGGEVHVGRPVEDAFGLVDAGGLPGIRVYRNGQSVGRTDERGRLFMPRLDAFHVNEVTIDDRDLPLSHTVDRLTNRVSPAFRQGALITFAVSRFSAVSGRMVLVSPAGERAGEYLELTLKAGDRTIDFPTGSGGEFYLENLEPGRYEATFPYDGREGVCTLDVPASEETFLELGTVRCTLR